jgi:hypothetical protein
MAVGINKTVKMKNVTMYIEFLPSSGILLELADDMA